MTNISQLTVSRIVATVVPRVKTVLEEFVPTTQDAIELVNGQICLADPCFGVCGDELQENGRVLDGVRVSQAGRG
ncbi:MAG: hypothetical protein ACRDTC_19470 [Pseudonocardiaceae bacterium]